MPMIWLYVFLQDFLIPFLCDPDLQCWDPQFRIEITLVKSLQSGDPGRICLA
jgi:hypothetical protein